MNSPTRAASTASVAVASAAVACAARGMTAGDTPPGVSVARHQRKNAPIFRMGKIVPIFYSNVFMSCNNQRRPPWPNHNSLLTGLSAVSKLVTCKN